MISGLRCQTLQPLCVSAPRNRRLHPANRTHQLPASRGPPLPQSAGAASEPVRARLHPTAVLTDR